MNDLPSDYNERAATLGFATPHQVREALEKKDTVVIDVRSAAEIEASGSLAVPNLVSPHCHDCPDMERLAVEAIPSKDCTIT